MEFAESEGRARIEAETRLRSVEQVEVQLEQRHKQTRIGLMKVALAAQAQLRQTANITIN